ncbi:MAG: hypothetical protein LC769_07590, partial [Chloroflexi bacterium]|nr:hypothetical protein [Chloroflexota bacterium]
MFSACGLLCGLTLKGHGRNLTLKGLPVTIGDHHDDQALGGGGAYHAQVDLSRSVVCHDLLRSGRVPPAWEGRPSRQGEGSGV